MTPKPTIPLTDEEWQSLLRAYGIPAPRPRAGGWWTRATRWVSRVGRQGIAV
jgi:hypothetical protein